MRFEFVYKAYTLCVRTKGQGQKMKTYTGEQISQVSAAFAHLSGWNFETRLPKGVVAKHGKHLDLKFSAYDDMEDGFRYLDVDGEFRIQVCMIPEIQKVHA
jgi:hypothetical protein